MKTFDRQQIDPFWKWFSRVSDRLIDGTDGSLARNLGRHLRRIHPGLRWEIRHGISNARQLIVSPNLNPELRAVAQEVIFAAPRLARWNFCSLRPSKEWNYRLLIRKFSASPLEIDASQWTFVLLRSSREKHQVLLSGENMRPLGKNERWKMSGDALVNILGEEMVLDALDGFDLVRRLPSIITARAKPISLLRETIMVTPTSNCPESGVQCV